MRSKSTIVGIVYVVGFVIAAAVLNKAFASLFATIDVANRAILGDNFTLATLLGVVVAGALAAFLFVNPKSKTYVGDSVDEITKVAWPAWDETKVSTVVVIIFSFVCAAILGIFDTFFAWLTSRDFTL